VIYAFTKPNAVFPLGPVSAISSTALVFGYIVSAYKRLWKTAKFWLLLIVIFVIHSIGVYFAVFRQNHPPLLLVGALAGPEFFVIAFLIERFARSKDNQVQFRSDFR
jgi:hypothetical protein